MSKILVFAFIVIFIENAIAFEPDLSASLSIENGTVEFYIINNGKQPVCINSDLPWSAIGSYAHNIGYPVALSFFDNNGAILSTVKTQYYWVRKNQYFDLSPSNFIGFVHKITDVINSSGIKSSGDYFLMVTYEDKHAPEGCYKGRIKSEATPFQYQAIE